jgi:hypothetical protein
MVKRGERGGRQSGGVVRRSVRGSRRVVRRGALGGE